MPRTTCKHFSWILVVAVPSTKSISDSGVTSNSLNKSQITVIPSDFTTLPLMAPR